MANQLTQTFQIIYHLLNYKQSEWMYLTDEKDQATAHFMVYE